MNVAKAPRNTAAAVEHRRATASGGATAGCLGEPSQAGPGFRDGHRGTPVPRPKPFRPATAPAIDWSPSVEAEAAAMQGPNPAIKHPIPMHPRVGFLKPLVDAPNIEI